MPVDEVTQEKMSARLESNSVYWQKVADSSDKSNA
jgi:hypothetical protein